jgi:AcrR family transcriptional regulator
MAKPFHELRERLLRAGVAPRHVRRYLNELTDHLADLTTEERSAGHSPADAQSAALKRLGGMDELARAIIERSDVLAWSVRAPWATFGVAPIVLLAAAYFIALFILWSGWKLFLPGTDSPFVRVDGFSMFYFAVGRWIYYAAPILIGWGIGLVAARQRLSPLWPTVGLVVIAWIGGTAQVHASRSGGAGGMEHISMYFSLAPSLHTLVILSFAVLPFLIWRLQKTRFLST